MFAQVESIVRKRECMQETIRDISINWITGDIRILQSENEEIVIIQSAGTRFPESKLFQFNVNNGELTITDGRKQKINIGFNVHKTDLEIHLPKKKFNAMNIESVGSHLSIHHVDVNRCRCNITSGKAKLSGKMIELDIHATACHISGDNLEIEKLNIHTTSSPVNLSGEFLEFNAHSTGRSVVVRSSTMLQRIQSISTAANVTVSIPENEGFRFQFKKVSGNFKSDFPLSSDGESYSYKNGLSQFNAEVRGGKFTLERV
ncbi:DUF4097 family beta strand repeat-containing protein [Paenibacillus glacialis]|uniref:DUF4097 domain-containing protein n=1 Tax=Paenibacillus glacialis TaxID=494026 RepID=A0A168KS68_9BACL|nr:DUF4097 family beta strand repeat-containing protein [Paenibacillus glacialis]OAB42395.1 hypothetical protein PGLA_12015 [Paenibacillus glacialis]